MVWANISSTRVAALHRGRIGRRVSFVCGLGYKRSTGKLRARLEPMWNERLLFSSPTPSNAGSAGRSSTDFEKKGLQIVGAKFMKISQALAETHYAPHKGKPFYDGLVKFMTSSPVVVIALAGKDAVAISRKMMGATFGSKAEPGTIRGDFGVSNSFNLIHGSDSVESAQRELGLFFKPEELLEWMPAIQSWVYDFAKGQPE